jgi:polysaccharide export outer membrane protein
MQLCSRKPTHAAQRAPRLDHPSRGVALLCLSLSLWGCGTTSQSQTTAPAGPSSEGAAAANKPSDDYLIGPGDTIQVFVWRNPELTSTVPVRPDGKISTPLVEDMIAVGKKPAQLARDIEVVLAQFVRSPQVNVIVSQSVSAFSQVKIVGQVVRPQALAFREGMTVLDAILAVGGLGPFAAGNRSKLVRVKDGKQEELRVKLEDLVNRGDMSQNVTLRAGDVLVVPESRF